jgi:uncharacterized protein (TIGR03437 family)
MGRLCSFGRLPRSGKRKTVVTRSSMPRIQQTGMKPIHKLAAIAGLGLASLHAQTVDTSGNFKLDGNYRFRQLAVTNWDDNGNPTEITAVYGVITFNGAGAYTLTGTYVDNTVSNGGPQAISISSTSEGVTGYAIGASGAGWIANPLFPTDTGSVIYGSLAQGVFIGSAQQSENLNDLFIAIPAGTPPTNSSFTSAYWIGVEDFTGASYVAMKNALFEITPNGSGSLGTINFTGQAYNQSSTPILSQTTTGATYAFQSDGSAILTFPLPSGVSTANALVTGTRTIFESADGNFIVGYNPTGYDMIFGVRAVTSAAPATPPNGLYFWGALEDPGAEGVDSYYGSILSYGDSNGDAVEDQQVNYVGGYSVVDYGTDNALALNTNGTSGPISGVSYPSGYCASVNGTTICPDGDGVYMYAFGGNNLNAFVAIGYDGYFSLLAGVVASPTSTTGVYLNPVGIINAASYAPMTANLAPGEAITLYGSNLSSVTMSPPAGPAPTILGGTQVLVNGTAAPLYYVSPGQINAVIPYEVSSAYLATIQVVNNGTGSNSVGNMYISDSAPGVFTVASELSPGEDGIGFAAALHADYTLITPSNPAMPGEEIAVYLTGLGLVTPAVSDGGLGGTGTSSSPLNDANLLINYTCENSSGAAAPCLGADFNDYVNGNYEQTATINYAGLAPGLLGYQLNVTIPTSDVGPALNGGVYLEIYTDSADNNQVQIPVGDPASSVRPAARTPRTPGSRHSAHNAAVRAAHGKKPSRRLLPN